ncbi:hypothetical protein CRYUN_Cryun03dG0101000 [Craigia yunnanensis]
MYARTSRLHLLTILFAYQIHSSDHTFPDPPPDAKPLNSSTHKPIPSISEADELDPSSNATSIDDRVIYILD